jgi:predicted aspartyl protease
VKGLFTADREAVLQIEVRGPGGQAAIVSTVIDTGFTGYLTLPSDLLQPWDFHIIATLRARWLMAPSFPSRSTKRPFFGMARAET